MKKTSVYSVSFRSADGFVFNLFTSARKALTYAREATNKNENFKPAKDWSTAMSALNKHTVELRQARSGTNVYFYDKDEVRFTVSREVVI